MWCVCVREHKCVNTCETPNQKMCLQAHMELHYLKVCCKVVGAAGAPGDAIC